MSKLTQGTHVYFLDKTGETAEVVWLRKITDFNPGTAPASRIDETTLEDLLFMQYRSGLRDPGVGSVSIRVDPEQPSHVALQSISQVSPPPNIPWAVGWSDGTEPPRAGGSVGEVEVTAPGTGYTEPTVSLSAPDDADGVQATATAQFSGGEITGITVTNPGSGYNTAPTVTINDGGSGSGATATATLGESVLILPTTRTWNAFDASLEDFPFEFSGNTTVATQIGLQRTGGMKWQQKVAA